VAAGSGDTDGAARHLGLANLVMHEFISAFGAEDRARVLANVPLHRETRQRVVAASSRIVVTLSRAGPSSGRNDVAEVTWTIVAPGDSEITPAERRRHHVVQRLLAEAAEQDGVPTHDDLAAALGVSRRTIIRDLQTLADQGIAVSTKGSSRRHVTKATTGDG
jgi:biotin operon repressor